MALRKCFLTKQQLEEISKRMNDGENRGQIAKDFGMNIGTIRKLLKENGFTYDSNFNNKKVELPFEEVKKIYEEYLNGLSFRGIREKYNLTDTVTARLFKENGFDYKNSARYGKHKDFNLKKDYFSEIDTDEKAYWLGFLLADGYIDKKYESLEFTLKESDLYIIEKFKETLCSEAKIQYRKKQKAYRIIITSVDICRDLKKHGIENNKSLKYSLNKEIMDSEFKDSYVRGLFDGNGYIYNKDNRLINCGICGNIQTLEDIKNYYEEFKDIKIVPQSNPIIGNIKIGHNKTLSFLRKLYKNATIKLERKFKLFAVYDENCSKDS